jgi:hypothetical protein
MFLFSDGPGRGGGHRVEQKSAGWNSLDQNEVADIRGDEIL